MFDVIVSPVFTQTEAGGVHAELAVSDHDDSLGKIVLQVIMEGYLEVSFVDK